MISTDKHPSRCDRCAVDAKTLEDINVCFM